MRILADENCDRLIVEELRNAGHDVISAMEDLSGGSDGDLFRLAHAQQRVLLTDDLDFGHITKMETLRPPAVVIVRIDGMSRDARAKRVLNCVRALEGTVGGHIAVIEPGQVRLRAMQSLST